MDKFLSRAVAPNVGASGGGGTTTTDPHNLKRFISKQATDHRRALQELNNGRKAGCWSWWIFPTPPFIRNGQRVGSGLNATYELADDTEGLAYLSFSNGSLRANYLAIVAAANAQLAAGTHPKKLLGIDVPRFEASTKYFAHLADKAADAELGALCARTKALLHPEQSASSSASAAAAGSSSGSGSSSSGAAAQPLNGNKRALPGLQKADEGEAAEEEKVEAAEEEKVEAAEEEKVEAAVPKKEKAEEEVAQEAKDKQVDFFQKVVEEKMEEEKSKEQQEAEKEAVARLQTEDNGGGKMVE